MSGRENLFWFFVCTTIILVVGVVTWGIVHDNNQDRALIDSLVQKGHTPVEARCATMSATNFKQSPACLAVAVTGNLKAPADGTDPY